MLPFLNRCVCTSSACRLWLCGRTLPSRYVRLSGLKAEAYVRLEADYCSIELAASARRKHSMDVPGKETHAMKRMSLLLAALMTLTVSSAGCGCCNWCRPAPVPGSGLPAARPGLRPVHHRTGHLRRAARRRALHAAAAVVIGRVGPLRNEQIAAVVQTRPH